MESPASNLPKNRPDRAGEAAAIVGIVFGLSLLYAVTRYNIVRNVPWIHVPLYIGNKATALAATLLIGLSFILGPLARFWPKYFVPELELRKPLGLWGFGLAVAHMIMSMILLGPAYFARWYGPDGKLTLTSEISLLAGVVAIVIFGLVAISSLPSVEQALSHDRWERIQRYGYLAYCFVLIHVAVMGYRGWSNPENYRYGLASISLVATSVILLVFLARLLAILWPRNK